jgi:hypothetical protein
VSCGRSLGPRIDWILAILADAGATPEADALRDLLATAGDPLGSDR